MASGESDGTIASQNELRSNGFFGRLLVQQVIRPASLGRALRRSRLQGSPSLSQNFKKVVSLLQATAFPNTVLVLLHASAARDVSRVVTSSAGDGETTMKNGPAGRRWKA
jgi:hypothetical protein